MKDAYLEYYTPLVNQFCKEMSSQQLDGLDHMPQPFLPLFGKDYERSSLRLLIMGQDTKGWGDCRRFMEKELENPGSEIEAIFREIEDQNFKNWGRNTHSFWGFVMALLAGIHGMPNWNVLKWGQGADVLRSFAWANANAVELWPSLRKHTSGVPQNTWVAARKAGAHFNRLTHILTVLKPRVILITCSSINKEELFAGVSWVQVDTDVSGVTHYRVDEYDVDIFHTYHPNYMRNVGGPWSFLNKTMQLLAESGLAPDVPAFVTTDEAGDTVVEHLLSGHRHNDLGREDKYKFVEWVSRELSKHKAFMSVPALADLLNRAGYRTNYGSLYSGKRGSYRLVRGAYWRAKQRGDDHAAQTVAETFRKPNFTYAY